MTRRGLRNVPLFNRPLLHQLLFGGNKINFGAAPVGQSPLCALRNGNVGHVTCSSPCASPRAVKNRHWGTCHLCSLHFSFLLLDPIFAFRHVWGGLQRKHLRPQRGKQAGVNSSFPSANVEKLFSGTPISCRCTCTHWHWPLWYV